MKAVKFLIYTPKPPKYRKTKYFKTRKQCSCREFYTRREKSIVDRYERELNDMKTILDQVIREKVQLVHALEDRDRQIEDLKKAAEPEENGQNEEPFSLTASCHFSFDSELNENK